MALALGWVATLHVQNPLSWDGQGENQPIQNKIHRGAQGTVHSFITKKWQKKHGSPLRGFWTCGMATKPRASVIGSSLWIRAVPWKCLSLNFLSYISCPLEAIAWRSEPNWCVQERKIFHSMLKWRFEATGVEKKYFCSFFFGQQRTARFPLVFFLVVEKPKH